MAIFLRGPRDPRILVPTTAVVEMKFTCCEVDPILEPFALNQTPRDVSPIAPGIRLMPGSLTNENSEQQDPWKLSSLDVDAYPRLAR
jgi:hypothetical protein